MNINNFCNNRAISSDLSIGELYYTSLRITPVKWYLLGSLAGFALIPATFSAKPDFCRLYSQH